MANRVLINASGLKVSKPGQNVLTAPAAQLQFSSDWSAMGVYRRGTHTINWSLGSGDDRRHAATIALGKTFASVPYVSFYWVFPDRRVPLGNGPGFSLILEREDYGDGEIVEQSSRFIAVAQVSTTAITVSAMYTKHSSGVVTPQMTFEYIIFDNNL